MFLAASYQGVERITILVTGNVASDRGYSNKQAHIVGNHVPNLHKDASKAIILLQIKRCYTTLGTMKLMCDQQLTHII